MVIPSHNRTDALLGAVGDLRRQTLPPAQIVVVDDGSQPPVSPESLQRAADGIAIHLVRHDLAQGPGAARNAGIAAADAEWIAFHDDDDRFRPDKLAVLADAASTPPLPDVLYHPARITMVREAVGYDSRPADLEHDPDPYRRLLIANVVGGTSMVAIRRSVLIETGGFDTTIRNMEDHELWMRLARAGARFRLVPEVLTQYRSVTGGGNLSSDGAAFDAGAARIERLHADGYRTLTPEEHVQRRLWLLNSATLSALVAGDTRRARRLQWRALRLKPGPAAAARAAVTLLGPRAAFRLRARLDRGPTSG